MPSTAQSTPSPARDGYVYPEPSDAQKEAGNYLKQHYNIQGMRVSVENPAGTYRAGKDGDGKEWSNVSQHSYGYIRSTQGRDKDHLDVFLGPHAEDASKSVFVVDQHKPDGGFDEHKVMLGFPDEAAARAAYQGNYPHGWEGDKNVTPMSVADFKAWAFAPGRRTKPVAETQKFAAGGAVRPTMDPKTPADGRDGDVRAALQDVGQLPRGWVAGTLGLPGDIEGLLRSALKAGATTPALPTTDFYKDWLPLKRDGKGAQAMGDAGSFLGGLGSTKLARGALGLLK